MDRSGVKKKIGEIIKSALGRGVVEYSGEVYKDENGHSKTLKHMKITEGNDEESLYQNVKDWAKAERLKGFYVKPEMGPPLDRNGYTTKDNYRFEIYFET